MAKKDNKDNKEKMKKNFFKDLKAELKKVTWPTFKKLVNNTSAVIAVVLIVVAIVFVLDVCFENLNKFSVEKLKSLVASDNKATEEVQNEKSTGSEEGIDLTPTENEGEEVKPESEGSVEDAQ